MKLNDKENIWSKVSSLLMLVTLAWLTISTPFVYDFQQKLKQLEVASLNPGNIVNVEDNDGFNNMLQGPTEEKTETNSNNFSEYLHHHDFPDDYNPAGIKYLISVSSELYLAFHGELLSPPPDSLV